MAPVLPPIPHRIGGFGGAAGLAAYLRDERMELLIDATHPFANRISANAAEAAESADVRRLVLQRGPWTRIPGDDWHEVPSVSQAAEAIGAAPARVFLTIGRQDLLPFRDLAPQHLYLVRSVDPPETELLPPKADILTGRGPFDAVAERNLMESRRVNVLVTKNSGGPDGKLAAARALCLPVIMVARPPPPPGETVATASQAVDWIARHAGRAPVARGA